MAVCYQLVWKTTMMMDWYLYNDFDKIKEVLIKNGYSEDVRAEALPIEMFVEISNCL